MDRQHPITCLKSLDDAFAKSDKVTLYKSEYESIMETIRPAMRTGDEVGALEPELKRVRKVAAPAWKAWARVSQLMAKYGCKADERKIREWKSILDDARVIYWRHLPQRLRHRWKEFTGL